MAMERLFDGIKEQIAKIINENYGPIEKITWKKTPNLSLGDISFPLFALAKELNIAFSELGETIMEHLRNNEMIERIELKGGFLNIFLNRSFFAKRLLKLILDEQYLKLDHYSGNRIIIEHTSSNPNGPLHVGNFRGSVIGDVLARLFRFLGAQVNVRYYVNDLGKQIAPLVIGYHLLKKANLKPDCKIDLWIGKIYATMNTLLEIQQLKEELLNNHVIKELKNPYEITTDEMELIAKKLENVKELRNQAEKLLSKANKYYNVQNSLRKKIPTLYEKLLSLLKDYNVNLRIEATKTVTQYQNGVDDKLKIKVREVTESALSGHIETLRNFGIIHDDFDWESEIAWSGEVEKILTRLEKGGWLRHDGQARLLMNDKIAEELGFKEKYGIKYKIPDTILVNSDGVTLYPCRDIAYHLHKLEKFSANICYNVIGKQQQLPQLAVRLALYALGKKDIADKIIHVDYEYVSLVGRKMSGRELEYVTPDELFELSRNEIIEILKERGYNKEEEEKIAKKVAISSVKYHILKIDPQKQVVFDAKKAVDPNENTGPFLQYSYARAVNILKKAEERGIKLDYTSEDLENFDFIVEKDEEWLLLLTLEEFPNVLVSAAKQLRPDFVANFTFNLASTFHKFYDTCPVIGAENENIRAFRFLLVNATIKALKSLFNIIGIEQLEKM